MYARLADEGFMASAGSDVAQDHVRDVLAPARHDILRPHIVPKNCRDGVAVGNVEIAE